MAISYKILSVRQDAETVTASVEYTIDGTVVNVDVPIFMPKTKDDIITGVTNRGLTEKAKLDAIALAETIVPLISENETGTIEG